MTGLRCDCPLCEFDRMRRSYRPLPWWRRMTSGGWLLVAWASIVAGVCWWAILR